MAVQSGRGHAPSVSRQDTKTERTAPTKAVTDNVPSDMSRGGYGSDNPRTSHYGRNGFAGPSSLTPGERMEAAGARLATNEDVDLETVRTGAFGVGDQLRDIGAKNVPLHPSHAHRGASSGSPGGSIPDRTGASVEQPVRRPK
jgi:hypothetical protein